MEFLKTDLAQFKNITDFPYRPHFFKYEGLEMHFIDEGKGETFLALHGEPTWSYLYRKFIPVLSDYRFIAPDFIGFGKSDKLKNWEDYSFELHLNSTLSLIENLNLNDINLIVHDWGGLIGLSALAQIPHKIKSVIILNTFLPKGNKLPLTYKIWRKLAKHHPSFPVAAVIKSLCRSKLTKQTIQAYKAPFPDKEFKTGPKSFPLLIPSTPNDKSIHYLLKARQALSEWHKPSLILFSDKDPVFKGLDQFFYKLIPSASNLPQITIKDASHFLQEDKGEEIANYIKLFIENKLATVQKD